MIAILGSGFGLYGYLPALVQGCGQTVALPQRYQPRFAARPELQGFAKDIQWYPDESATLHAADGVVLVLRPADQMAWIPRCLALPNLQVLILEKPLAPTPAESAVQLALLEASGRQFRVNYSFARLRWRQALQEATQARGSDSTLRMDWHFRAHHLRTGLETWKRHTELGGGVVRFYGIHLIALMAELGYDAVLRSTLTGNDSAEATQWSAVFAGPGLPDCEVCLDADAALNRFCIHAGDALVTDLADPFDLETDQPWAKGQDRRVPVLAALCQSVWQPTQDHHAWYAASIRLWQAVEDVTGQDSGRDSAGGPGAQESH